jgi:glyoxylase-like metal-dependent hydrolase (beta-lactamase superfamily II)
MRFPALLAVAVLIPVQASRPAPHVIQVTDGVLLFQTQAYGDVGLDGNSVAVIGDDGVLVFDANGTPAASAAVLAEIRRRTDKPVSYVVYSHWHWDHWYGTETYAQAFPGLRVIAHEKTRELMAGPAIEFNRPGLETQLPAYLGSLEKRAASDPSLRPLLDEDRFFLEQKRNAHLTLPNVTYADAMDVYLGTRRVEIRHYDRAVTPGDTFLYLPKERVLITGDLLVNPVSFALSCYPTGWLRTLEKMDTLDAEVIVPGHGDPVRDKRLLRATMAVMRQLLREGEDARKRGLDPDRARDEIFPRLHDQMVAITGDDPKRNQEFKTYLVDWYLHRVYDELAGPLTDAIAPIPAK